MYLYACNDFKIPLHYCQNSTSFAIGQRDVNAFVRLPITTPAIIGVTLHPENEFSRAINSRIA